MLLCHLVGGEEVVVEDGVVVAGHSCGDGDVGMEDGVEADLPAEPARRGRGTSGEDDARGEFVVDREEVCCCVAGDGGDDLEVGKYFCDELLVLSSQFAVDGEVLVIVFGSVSGKRYATVLRRARRNSKPPDNGTAVS